MERSSDNFNEKRGYGFTIKKMSCPNYMQFYTSAVIFIPKKTYSCFREIEGNTKGFNIIETMG